ncbi:DUF397 domain-containing protein [Spirillospora sp. NPDC047279]|uniref:DUF397 domain-containing protein n=1 Tax=Spirillospora sp. NPDC047279 TaxID=3155478 RepID=UPI0033D6FDBF
MTDKWRKSSYSHDSNSDCVEVAWLGVRVAVRDSKAVELGCLVVRVGDFAGLVRRIKVGELDLRG